MSDKEFKRFSTEDPAHADVLNEKVVEPGEALRQAFNQHKTEVEAEIQKTKDDFATHLAETTQNAHLAKNIGIEDAAGNFTSTNVEGALNELFQSVSDGKAQLEAAITDMGGTVSKQGSVATFNELDSGIRTIQTGVTPVDAILKDYVIREGETLTAGDLVEFINNKAIKSRPSHVDFLSDEQVGAIKGRYATALEVADKKLLVIFANYTTGYYPTAVLLMVNDDGSISVGAPLIFASRTSSSNFYATQIDESRVIVMYNYGSDYGAHVKVLTISGMDLISGSNEVTLDWSSVPYANFIPLSSNRILVIYSVSNGAYGHARVLTINEAVISEGTRYVFASGQGRGYHYGILLEGERVLTTYLNLSNRPVGSILEISGDIITYTSPVYIDSETEGIALYNLRTIYLGKNNNGRHKILAVGATNFEPYFICYFIFAVEGTSVLRAPYYFYTLNRRPTDISLRHIHSDAVLTVFKDPLSGDVYVSFEALIANHHDDSIVLLRRDNAQIAVQAEFNYTRFYGNTIFLDGKRLAFPYTIRTSNDLRMLTVEILRKADGLVKEGGNGGQMAQVYDWRYII